MSATAIGVPMFLNDLRLAFRGFVRQPRFGIAALLTLALGIGANVAVFAVFEAVMLRPLPYTNADDLVVLQHRDRRTGITKEFIAIGDFVDVAVRQAKLEQLVSYSGGQGNLVEPTGPVRIQVLSIGPGFFETLRIRPVQGRAFTADDARDGAARVAMVGYEFWQSHYDGDPGIVGRTVRLGNDTAQIVGIAPPGLAYPPGPLADVISAQSLPITAPTNRKAGWTFAMGRLVPGATTASMNAELSAISQRMENDFPTQNQGSEYYVEPLRDTLVGATGAAFPLLLSAVAVVLLIACANVANLLLVRSLGRQREFAVRQALGADRRRLISQMLAEALVLAIVAAVAGTLAAHWGARALVRLIPNADAIPGMTNIGINPAVLAFALGIAVITAVMASLQSVFAFGKRNLSAHVVASRGTSQGIGARRATGALVVAEVALGIVLLLGAGLILRSFERLISVDPGFNRDGVLTVSVVVPNDRYPTQVARRAFSANAERVLEALPGVIDVGYGIVVPLTGNNWTVAFQRADQPVPEGTRPPDVGWQSASAGFFSTLQIPLKSGRLFDDTDQPGGRPVVIISEGIEERYFPEGGAVGRMVRLGQGEAEIVGVVGDIRRAGLRDVPRADMYFPFEQAAPVQHTMFVRTEGDPGRAVPAIREALFGLESRILVQNPRTMAEIAREDTQLTELLLWLLGVFAMVALGLAAIGLYGVMSHVVRLRTREIGTRIALGAARSDIVRMVMRSGATMTGLGVALGVAGGLLAVRLLGSAVYGVGLTDPLSLIAAAVTMLAAGAIACYIPARRAAMVDPARTLADEG